MECLNESEAIRVLQAAAAMDAARSTGYRPVTLPAARPPAVTQQQHQAQQQQLPVGDTSLSGFGDDNWREMEETEGGETKRPGDLDTWLDVFRATATSVQNAWRHVECLSYESLAFGWLALARKHEPLQVATSTASGADVTDIGAMARWLSEAQWAQAAYRTTSEEQLRRLLGLQPTDLLVYQSEPSGQRPAFFLAVHHDSRTVRLVIRGSGHLRDLLTHVAGAASPFGAGFAHQGLLQAAEQLLADAGGAVRAALEGNPGYGLQVVGHALGAGTAALVALLLSTDATRAQSLGVTAPPPGDLGADPAAAATAPVRVRVRATCFGPPPAVTAEVAEQCAPYVDSVVYNTDLVSRCGVASLRRLANEIAAASQEVLARSELAQALRRSGALGLANHVVAAALCRCQPPQDAVGITRPLICGPGPLSEGVEAPPVRAATASLSSSPPSPPPPVPAAPPQVTAAPLPSQLSGRATLVQGQTPSVKTSISVKAPNPKTGSRLMTGPSTEPPSPIKAVAGDTTDTAAEDFKLSSCSAPLPLVAVPSGFMLPKLVPVGGGGGGSLRSGSHEAPVRKNTESQGVLSPPPLVAAAAAALSTTAAAAAMGPTPSRRGLIVGSLGDHKCCVQQEVRTTPAALAAAAAALASNGGDDGGSRPEGAVLNAAAGVVLVPLAAPPVLPPGMALPAGSRRDAAAADCFAIVTPLAPPAQLPPLLLQSQSVPRLIAVRGAAHQPHHEQPQSGEKPGRFLTELPLPLDHTSSKVLLPPPPPQQQHGDVGGEDRAGSSPPSSACSQEYPELQVPGRLYFIERRGADAHASFRLLPDFKREHLNRILLKRSMLRDHLLSHYVATLERLIHSLAMYAAPEAPTTPTQAQQPS